MDTYQQQALPGHPPDGQSRASVTAVVLDIILGAEDGVIRDLHLVIASDNAIPERKKNIQESESGVVLNSSRQGESLTLLPNLDA